MFDPILLDLNYNCVKFAYYFILLTRPFEKSGLGFFVKQTLVELIFSI